VITSLAQQLRTERVAGRNSEPRLKEFQRLHPDCMNVFIADARGQIVASAEARPAGQIVSSVDTDWFREVQKTRRFTVSNMRMGRSGRSGSWWWRCR
jgi:hypothetical protein